MRFWGKHKIFLLLLLPFFILSCKYELVGETSINFTEKKNAADYNDFILPPSYVNASHGLAKSVELEWEAVPNAVQYQIFSAETPFDTFTKISETRDAATTITIDEEAGISKYYCVCAVNYYGTVSSKSVVVSGSSLAVPVITEIDAEEEGDSVLLKWWMDNCSKETYQDDVSFNIYAYLKSSPGIKLKSITLPGDLRELRITGLVSKTEYLFEVEVTNNTSSSKETSGKYTAETAHRVLPDAPLDFSVTKGESLSQIKLKWKTPAGAWYRENSGTSGFVMHPLYFEIYRKETGSSSDFKKIKTIKLDASEEDEINLNFSTEDKEHCENLDSPYEGYYIDADVSYTDTIEDTDRGKRYTYYVQSVTDKVPQGKRITAESSCTAEQEGWTISVPVFSIVPDYQKSADGTKFEKISFTCNLQFENYGIPYTYFVKREQLAFNGGSAGSPQLLNFSSVESVNTKTDEFIPVPGNPDSSEKGYYTYVLYVCKPDATQSDYQTSQKLFDYAQASGKYIVTDDAASIPQITDFAVDDGYSDKYILSWTYNSEYVYTIHWWEVQGNERGSEQTQEFVPGAGLNNGGHVSFTHQAESGSRRYYALEASTGISETARLYTDETKTVEKIFETLGTAAPSFTIYDYDSITVTWPKVQQSDGIYTVSAKYEGENQELVNGNIQIAPKADDANVYECVISQPSGYNDATISGKKINLTVKAKNTKGQTTCDPIPVCTLGPALAGIKVAQTIEDNKIAVQWNKIEGAAGYKIIRKRFTDGSAQEAAVNGEDVYYFDGSEISVGDAAVDSDHAEIRDNADGTLMFTDKAIEAIDPTNAYTINQACIAWGLPFSYEIIPVKQGSDNNTVNYSNRQPKLGATKGYGFKVYAQKAVSGTTQVITWDAPYYYDRNENPSVYYRDAGSTDNRWTKIDATFAADKKSASIEPESNVAAYEYLVAYKRASSTLNEKVPDSFIQDTTLGLAIEENRPEYDYTDRLSEKANKGYLMAVGLKLRRGLEYSEIVSWDEWDYNLRSIGPDSAYISIINYNLKNPVAKVVTLDSNLHYESKENLTNTVITESIAEFEIKPDQVMEADNSLFITEGPLQILRDARHYYYITLEKSGQSSVELYKNEKYVYRKISQKELAKCAMLIMAYGFYLQNGGNENYSDIGEQKKYKRENKVITDGNGSASFSSSSLLVSPAGKYEATVKFTNFAPLQLNPGNTSTNVISISTTSAITFWIKGLSDHYVYLFNKSKSFDITVNHVDEEMPESYSAKLTVTCTSQGNLTIEIGGTTIINTTSVDERKKYLPLLMAGDGTYWLIDSSLGWWN